MMLQKSDHPNAPQDGKPQEAVKLPPHNIEAEQALIGAVLVNNDAFDRVSDFFQTDHLFDPLHQRIWDTLSRMVGQGTVVTPVTLKPFFDHEEPLGTGPNALTVPQYLGRLAMHATSVLNAEDYARTIRDLYLRRELILIGEQASALAYDSSADETAESQIETLEGRLFALGDAGVRRREISMSEAVKSAMVTVEAAHSGARLSGLRCGFKAFDNGLGGFQPGQLIILAARPSMGKTALALNIGVNVARNIALWSSGRETTESGNQINPGCPVAFFSLEMSAEQLALRALSHASRVDSATLRHGKAEERIGRVRKAADSLDSLPIYFEETGALPLASLALKARKMVRQHGVGLIIVDYLQLMAPNRNHASKVGDVTEISNGLKALAKDLRVPVLALSQLSRAVETRADKRPQLSDLRESGAIEQDADVVVFIYRDEYYLAREEPPEHQHDKHDEWDARMQEARGRAELIIGKQRNGPIGTHMTYFTEGLTLFHDDIAGVGAIDA